MAQIAVAGAGNANENINLINPRFQAEALRQIRGYDVGVLKNTFFTSTSATGTSRTANPDFMWKLNISGGITSIKVGRGMATAYGYDIQSEADVTLNGTIPASGTKYVFIYLEWDLHNPDTAVGSIKMRDNGTSSTWTPSSQDNLITNPTGTYQMILYRMAVNTSGSITSTANWESFGVKTIGYNLRSEHANHAENADEAVHAEHSDHAIYTAENTAAGTIDARIIDINNRLNNLGFKAGVVTFCGTNYGSTTNGGTVTTGTITWANGPANPYTYQNNSLKDKFTVSVKSFTGQITSVHIITFDSTTGTITYAINNGSHQTGSGTVTFAYSETGMNGVQRSGNFVIVNLEVAKTFTAEQARNYLSMGTSPIISLPTDFRPKRALTFFAACYETGRTDIGQSYKITLGTDGNAYSSLLATSNGFIVGAEWNFKIRIGFETLAPGYASSGSSGSSVLADIFKLPYRATTAENEAARNAIKNNDWATFLRYKPSGRSDESWRQLYEQYGGQ